MNDLPLVADVDVLVIGGSSGAVACAAAAARAGRRTYLVAPRSYFGDDIAASMDYWPSGSDEISSDLARAVFPQGADPAATPPTPMHVKRTLDEALIEAGVSFLFNTHPAGVLRDASGRVAGCVIANRNGRQAIAARQVVDATDRALLARQAGAAFSAGPHGMQVAHHVTLGGEPIDEPDITHEALPPMLAPGKDGPIELVAHRNTLRVDVGDGSWHELARAYAQIVDRCWRPGVWQHSERLELEAHERLAAAPLVDRWPGVEALPIEALSVEPGLHVLGPAARLGDDAATRMRRPAHRMGVGRRLGEHLATDDAASAGPPVTVACAGSEPIDAGQLRVAGDGLRPGQPPLDRIADEDLHLPRLCRFDVVIVGGGTAGASAGIGAARAGAATLVCEAGPALGGVGTLGQIASYYFGNIVGFTSQIDDGVAELEPDEKRRENRRIWSPAAKQAWYLRELRGCGADVWFNVTCCGAWVVEGRVRGVVIAGPHGVGLVEAGAVVDATGNADVAAAAGAPTTGIGAEHVAVQGTGLAGVNPDRPGNNTDHSFSDDTDLVDASAFFVTSREKFASDFDAGQLIDSRERRQIVGEIELEPVDFLSDRRFPDAICLHSSNFDTHGYTIHPMFMVKPPNKERMWVYVPYRCLIPRSLDGVLVTGLGVSAHRDAIPVIRMQADVQNQGYAAGRAAAMAAEQHLNVRDIDIKALQRHLVEISNLPENVLTDEDTFPVDDATLRWAVDEGWDDYLGIGLCFAEPERSVPLLRAAHDRAVDDARRQRYALMLALLGQADGAATLRDALAGRDWDEGWNYRGMGQFGMSMSEVDAMLVGLTHVDDERAWPIVLDKARALDDEPDFSHCRAVGEACERLHARHPNPEAAETLATLLERPGIVGHAQPTLAEARRHLTDNKNEDAVRNRALREIHLARALYRCGDLECRAAAILHQYAEDLRGHFARHARAVLREADQR